MDSVSENDNTKYCKLCNEKIKIYNCPRCGIGYCSLNCYKSERHLDCTESFYKQCVEEELKSLQNDPETKLKMFDIFKRLNEQDLENDTMDSEDKELDLDDELDSDDETDLPDLEERLKNINLDIPDEIWAVLNNDEKQQFKALVKSGEASTLLPPWIPWWITCRKSLIETLDTIEENEENNKHKAEYPEIIDVPPFNKQKVVSSKILSSTITNVIYAYAYVALYYNGDYLSLSEEATNIFLSICDSMRINKTFDNELSALHSVKENIMKIEYLPKDEQTLVNFVEASIFIIKHPEKEQDTSHTCAALSELWRLLTSARKEIKVNKHKTKEEKNFSTKFTQHNEIQNYNLSRKMLFACTKKLEFYVSWIKCYGKDVFT
ncbi:PREDICTED: zinc finger HIT domain-containing protein 2 [Polistes canadensis]|uniref:zinc finger HIT domain-containing protein 2 n=1 Tax=Polistes canadensis TaxID=91411 RepID=UPI000718DC72|nr:PREDICTED: zinc finger HIT domain-containing protein 2 [Polistes canadensis]